MTETNKLGKTLKDYTCPSCGYITANTFINNKEPVRCYHCRAPLKKSDSK